VHELDMPDAAPMSLLESLKLLLQKIEPFHITHNRGLSGAMRRLKIGRRKRAAQASVATISSSQSSRSR